MSRLKNQTERRLTLISAAESMIAKQGLPTVTLRSVANEAGMSSSAALYYYPGLKELLDDVQSKAIDRFCTLRAAAIANITDPRMRLRAMIDAGLPTGPDDQLCKLLLELGVYARTDASYAARHIALFERQVALYQGIFEAGIATGLFKLRASSEIIARTLVVIEDGLSLHLLNIVPAVDRPTAITILTTSIEQAIGTSLS